MSAVYLSLNKEVGKNNTSISFNSPPSITFCDSGDNSLYLSASCSASGDIIILIIFGLKGLLWFSFYSFPSTNSASAFSKLKMLFFNSSCFFPSASSASFSIISSASLMCSSASSRFSLSIRPHQELNLGAPKGQDFQSCAIPLCDMGI